MRKRWQKLRMGQHLRSTRVCLLHSLLIPFFWCCSDMCLLYTVFANNSCLPVKICHVHLWDVCSFPCKENTNKRYTEAKHLELLTFLLTTNSQAGQSADQKARQMHFNLAYLHPWSRFIYILTAASSLSGSVNLQLWCSDEHLASGSHSAVYPNKCLNTQAPVLVNTPSLTLNQNV